MDFVAIDVETANADMSSICQIGVARFKDSTLYEEWETYVNPQDYFDSINVSIHGIDESTVQGAPTFPEVADELRGLLQDSVAICHTHFDRVAIHQASQRFGISPLECTWLDSARIARRAWKACATKGYGLYNV